MRSSTSSIPHGQADHVVGDAEALAALRRHRRVGHGGGVADERLDAAEALGERHQPRPVENRARALQRPHAEGDHPAEPAHLAPREGVLRVRRQAGVVHGVDLRMRGQEVGQRHCVRVVALHPNRQRLGAAEDEPGVHRPEDGALRVLHEAQPLDVIVAHRHHHDAADAVGMTVQEFCRAVDDEVGAEVDRPLHGRARERVVDHDEHVVATRDLARAGQVGQAQHGVRRRLEKQHLRGRPDRALDLVEARRVGVGELEPVPPQHAFEQPIRAAIRVIGHDDVVAGL